MKMVKRAGRAYDPGGISATAPGSLAIPCRACPLPNINLPRGWENVPPERAYVISLNMDLSKFDVFRWLYTLIVGMDANFRLMSRLRSSIFKDPSLGPGWAYFVDNGPYSEFIKEYVDMDDVSCSKLERHASILHYSFLEQIRTCVGFQALLNMLTKKSKGLRATGMGAVSCARHQLFRALGMGDLQKGER